MMEAEGTYICVTVRDHRFYRGFENLLQALFLGDLDDYVVQKDTPFTQEEKKYNYISLFPEPLLG